MFAVTDRTAHEVDEVTLADYEQRDLAYDVREYLNYEVSLDNYVHTDDLLDAIDFSKTTTKEGKLTKRISKWVKEKHGIDLASHHISAIGNIIAAHQPGGFVYDITDTFDWQAGQFGDHGSCFWGEREDAKEIIRENGGLALRFYGADGYGNGRCWLLPHGKDWIAFNAYGPDLSTVRERIAALLPDVNVKKIRLENYGDSDGLLYINNRRGLLISQRELDDYDDNIDLEVGENHMFTCPRCEETTWEHNGNTYYIEREGRHVCYGCYSSNYGNCWCCDERVYHNDTTNVEIRYKHGSWLRTRAYICNDCFEENFVSCEECGYYLDQVNTPYQTIDELVVCGYCVKYEYTKCRECQLYIKNGDSCQCHDESATGAEEEVPEHLNIYNKIKAVMEEVAPAWMLSAENLRRLTERYEDRPHGYQLVIGRGGFDYVIEQQYAERYQENEGWVIVE